MKNMSLLSKILVGIGALMLPACAPMTPEDQRRAEERMLGLGTGYLSIYEKDPQKAATMGLTSQIFRDYDAAREGRSNVEQNVVIGGNSGDIPTKKHTANGRYDVIITKPEDDFKPGQRTEVYKLFGIEIYRRVIDDNEENDEKK